MKKTVFLTEMDINKMVMKSVRMALNEMSMYRKGTPDDDRETNNFIDREQTLDNINQLAADELDGEPHYRVNVERGEKVNPETDRFFYENDIIDKIIWRFKKLFPCRPDGMPRANNIMQWVRLQGKRGYMQSWGELPEDYTIGELYDFLCDIRFPDKKQG